MIAQISQQPSFKIGIGSHALDLESSWMEKLALAYSVESGDIKIISRRDGLLNFPEIAQKFHAIRTSTAGIWEALYHTRLELEGRNFAHHQTPLPDSLDSSKTTFVGGALAYFDHSNRKLFIGESSTLFGCITPRAARYCLDADMKKIDKIDLEVRVRPFLASDSVAWIDPLCCKLHFDRVKNLLDTQT